MPPDEPRLEKLGLGWANFQVLRRTHASLGHEAGIDPKVSADQRGHGIGVALDVYTHSSMEARRQAADILENVVLVTARSEGRDRALTEVEPVESDEKHSEAA